MPDITPLPVPPTREDADTFSTRADAFLLALQAVFAPELNTLRAEFLQLALDTANARDSAEASALLAAAEASSGLLGNFAGPWSTLSGALSRPASVYHDNRFWLLLVDLANVALSEPDAGNPDWLDARLVRETGATFSGSVEGPSANFAILQSSTATLERIQEGHQTVTGTTPTIGAAGANNGTWDLTGNSTPTVSLTDNTSFYLRVSDGAGYTIDWGSSGVVWLGDSGALPETGYAHFTFWRVNGTTYGVFINSSAS